MNRAFYNELADLALAQNDIDRQKAKQILTDPSVELMPLLNAAFEVRQHFVGKSVTIHIINNAQNGFCPEDCNYCAQAKSSKADINEYPLKSEEEFIKEAKNAYEKGAHRYCMVFAGRGPSQGRVEKLANLIRTIKSQYPLEICVSAGLIDEAKAKVLKDAGLDRLNHNLNTSKNNYPKICTTHTYEDRINTLQAARKAGIQLCSGVIIGMKETVDDIIDVAYELRSMNVESIPVNYLIPIKGNKLDQDPLLDPVQCLKILCLYRFLNPKAEIRVAAGREMHLRDMEVMALYAANSLFLDGYLNIKGNERLKTLKMIKDAGFTIESEVPIEEIIGREQANLISQNKLNDNWSAVIKDMKDLRPQQESQAI